MTEIFCRCEHGKTRVTELYFSGSTGIVLKLECGCEGFINFHGYLKIVPVETVQCKHEQTHEEWRDTDLGGRCRIPNTAKFLVCNSCKSVLECLS